MTIDRVFLGGVFNNPEWIAAIRTYLEIDLFSPISDRLETDPLGKADCALHVYGITVDMPGPYPLTDALESAAIPGVHTVLCVMPDGFDSEQKETLRAVCSIIDRSGGLHMWGYPVQIIASYIKGYCGKMT